MIPFEFYVTNTGDNCTDYWDGYSQKPIQVLDKVVHHVFFSNTSFPFKSYVYRNGTQVVFPETLMGAPYYGPPSNYYTPSGSSCGFPCVVKGGYVYSTTYGPMSPYGAWSYRFQASNLTVVTFHDGNTTLPRLHIVVNVSVGMLHNNASDWSITPHVEISGAGYRVVNSTGSVVYLIYTGLNIAPSVALCGLRSGGPGGCWGRPTRLLSDKA